jgi:ParB-like chromosome segregation protein Spo0J
MNIENKKIELLIPYSKNAKKHDKKQIKQVADSIKRFSFVQPIVIDKNNEVVIGHCRLEAAKSLGMTEVPVLSVENLSDKEVQALRLADNKLNESAWDMNLVIEDLKGLDNDLLDLTGFSADLLLEGDEKDDVLPENPPAIAKTGDLWQLGNHRLLCGDSTQEEAVLRLMGGGKQECVLLTHLTM